MEIKTKNIFFWLSVLSALGVVYGALYVSDDQVGLGMIAIAIVSFGFAVSYAIMKRK